jgi:hypothetical protein
LHLRLTLFNDSPIVAVIERMVVVLEDSEGDQMTFGWNLFFEQVQGQSAVQGSAPVQPITVGANSTTQVNVEFLIERVPKLDIFYDGIYACELKGWLARKSPRKKPAFIKSFSFTIPEQMKKIVDNPFFEQEFATDIPLLPL